MSLREAVEMSRQLLSEMDGDAKPGKREWRKG